MLGIALGNITVRQIFWCGNQFQCHFYHTPLPPKHPLKVDNIRPPFPLTTKVVIIAPLILGYKYEKLKEKKGWLKGSIRNWEQSER